MKVKPGELHLHHLAYDSAGTGWRVDLGHEASIRIESGGELSGALKKAIALRLAVCWNVLEGIPTDALMAGDVRLAFQVARELCDEIEAGKSFASKTLKKLVTTFRAADKALANVTADVVCGCKDGPIRWTVTKKGVSATGKGRDGRRHYEVKRHKTFPVWLEPPNKEGWGPYSWSWNMTKGMLTGGGAVGHNPIVSFEKAVEGAEVAELAAIEHAAWRKKNGLGAAEEDD